MCPPSTVWAQLRSRRTLSQPSDCGRAANRSSLPEFVGTHPPCFDASASRLVADVKQNDLAGFAGILLHGRRVAEELVRGVAVDLVGQALKRSFGERVEAVALLAGAEANVAQLQAGGRRASHAARPRPLPAVWAR